MSSIASVEYTNSRGHPVTQLFQSIPTLSNFYTNFEANYDVDPLNQWSKDTWPAVPLALCAVYLVAIFGGQWYMKDKKPFGDTNRAFLAAWNLFLSLFSFFGMVRTVPHLFHDLSTLPYASTVCNGPAEAANWGSFSTGLWVQLFIYSKPLELIDTFFIVVRKRPLIFLHWYHHVTVLLFCWHSYAFESSTGLFFVAMNYSVHAIMYGYYFLMAIRMKPKWMNPMFITLSQIAQMVVGVFVSLSAVYYRNTEGCNVKNDNLLAGGLMYGSYFALFAKFAVDRYLGKSGMKTGMESTKKKKA